MTSLLARIAGGLLVLLAATALLLWGGFRLSQWLLPAWPPDYHATAAIAVMSLGLIAGAAVAAIAGSRRHHHSAPNGQEPPSSSY